MLGRRGRRILLENCFDLHVVVRHEELVVLDGHAAADDLPLLEVVALVWLGGQGDLRTDHRFCMRGGSRSVAVRFHGDGKLGGCRGCILLEDGLDRNIGVRHGELVVLDGHAAADDLPLLEVVALFGHGGQGDLRAGRSGGRSCGTSAVSVIADGDGVGGGGNNAVLPQCFDLNIPVHGVGISHLVLCAADLPSLELLIGGSGEAAGGQDVNCPCLDGHGIHAAAATACVEGDCAIRKRHSLTHRDHSIGAGKVVVILRIADEVIAGRQVLNLDTGAGGVDSFALCTVFHRCIHASDFSVAAAHGGGRDTDQAVRRFLRGFADAPRCGHGLSAAVRPFAGLGCDANGVIARVRGGVAGDAHCGGIIAVHGCGMLGAIVGVGSGDADAGLGGIGGRFRLKYRLHLNISLGHYELVACYCHAAADDLPLIEVIALVWCGGQSDLRASRSLCKRCGSCAVAVRFHGDGKLGGCRRRVLLEDGLDLHVALRHGELVVGDYKPCRRYDLPLLEAVVLFGRCGQGDFRTSHGLVRRCGSRSVAVRADDLHVVQPVCSDCRRSLVSCVVSRDHGMFCSRVIVAAIRRGETIDGAGLRHAVDGHRLDAGGCLSRFSRVAHGEGVRAGISIDVILDGVALTVLQTLQHRRLRVRSHHIAAHSAELLLLAPVAGNVFGVLFGHFRSGVSRAAFHTGPDVAAVPVRPTQFMAACHWHSSK